MDDLNLTLTDGIPLEPTPEGNPRPSLVELSGANFGRQILLEKDVTIIGRGEEAEVRLTDARSSRKHTAIELVPPEDSTDTGYRIRDLDSRNGTFLNGQRVSSAPLHEGDKIQIGHTIFKFALKDTVELDFENKIYKLATTDPLTNLHTRDFFFKEFDRLARHCARYERPMSVMMVDLDDFKAINDTHGHIAGDRVLEAVAKLFAETLRNEDILGRYGGEEFIALLPETEVTAARFPGERFRTLLERRIICIPDGPDLTVTASIGLAALPTNGTNPEALVAAADKALYEAKNMGKNCIVIADNSPLPSPNADDHDDPFAR